MRAVAIADCFMKSCIRAGLATAITLSTPCAGLAQATKGESFYSDKSLLLLCTGDRTNMSRMCETYIRGVVETWFLKDVVGPDGPNYQYDGRGKPTFCTRILNVSSDEWTI
jgi:hypothetical protein